MPKSWVISFLAILLSITLGAALSPDWTWREIDVVELVAPLVFALVVVGLLLLAATIFGGTSETEEQHSKRQY